MTVPTPARVHVGTTIWPADGPRVRWIAPAVDGIGHAYPASKLERAACGVLPVDERFAYSVTHRHEECLVVVGAEQVRTGQEISESESRVLDGNR